MNCVQPLSRSILIIFLLIAGNACNNGSSEAGADPATLTAVDTAAPTARITFPPAVSGTEHNRITVRGTTSDESVVTLVRVNNVEATTTDSYANWEATVMLSPGINTLTVETNDINLNTDDAAASAQITVFSDDLLDPRGAVIDIANHRALVIDSGLDALVAVDLGNGVRSVISDSRTPDAFNTFSFPLDVTLDSANNRALVVDAGLDALIAVDLGSGARSVISDNTTPDGANPLDLPISVALDSVNNRALVIDNNLDRILAIDLISGARSIFSDSTNPDVVNPFTGPFDIMLDSANNRALVVDAGLKALMAVNLTDGSRSIISDNTTPNSDNAFITPRGVTLDTG